MLPLNVLMLFSAAGFGVRALGFSSARRAGRAGMAWAARVLSWIAFAIPCVMLGLTGSPFAIAALGAFVVLDAAGGLAAKDPDAPSTKPKGARKGGFWKRVKAPLLVGLYLTFVALVHFSVSIFLPFGVLLTWTLLALGFAVFLRASIVGPKAVEKDLRAPYEHRRHERREEHVADPQRHFADLALEKARKKNDVTPLLDFAVQIARTADLAPEQTRALEARIRQAGTQKALRDDERAHKLIDEIEAAVLAPTSTLSPSTEPHPRSAEATP